MSNDFEKDFQRLNASLKKIANSLNDRSVTIRLARKVKEIVYRRVKSGYGVDNDKADASNVNRMQLKELSKSYIDYRRGLVIFYRKGNKVIAIGKNNDTVFTNYETGKTTRVKRKESKITAPVLGEFGRPAKSNATLSGQMLNALTIDAGSGGFRIFIADTPRKKVHPKQKDQGLTNKQVAEYYSKDRPFMALTAGEVRILKAECELIIREKIKKLIR